jgi:hypothetical protein
MAVVPKISHVADGKPPGKAACSPRPDEGLSAWDFIRTGLVFTVIVAAVIAVVSSVGRITFDTVPVALLVLLMVSIAIWGGLALVAVPDAAPRRSRENNSSAEQASKGVESQSEWRGDPILRGE